MPTPPGAALLALNAVEVIYPGGTHALRATTMDVMPGEFLVLLGASGAGKSTLLRCLNGLVRPTRGVVTVQALGGGLDDRVRLRAHRRRTGMVFQHHHLIGRQTVLDNVLMGCVARRGALAGFLPWRSDDKRHALAAIERVGLLPKALQRADALSGGQQQRVGIARALVQQPALMLADEPVASLDPGTAERVLGMLHDICKSDGLSAVVSLHQVALARRFADRIVGLRGGGVVFDGPPDLLDPAAEALLYASTPSTRTSFGSAHADLPSLSPQVLST